MVSDIKKHDQLIPFIIPDDPDVHINTAFEKIIRPLDTFCSEGRMFLYATLFLQCFKKFIHSVKYRLLTGGDLFFDVAHFFFQFINVFAWIYCHGEKNDHTILLYDIKLISF